LLDTWDWIVIEFTMMNENFPSEILFYQSFTVKWSDCVNFQNLCSSKLKHCNAQCIDSKFLQHENLLSKFPVFNLIWMKMHKIFTKPSDTVLEKPEHAIFNLGNQENLKSHPLLIFALQSWISSCLMGYLSICMPRCLWYKDRLYRR